MSRYLIPLLSLSFTAPALGQASGEHPEKFFGFGDVLSVSAAGLLMTVPTVLEINYLPVECVPCDSGGVPFFDRWAIAPTRYAAATGSDVLRAGIATLSWLDLANEGPSGYAGIVASFQSMLWAESGVHLIKAIVNRNRPVLYTQEGVAVAARVSNHRSWPSGHAATAAALATSYYLTRSMQGKKDWRVWAFIAGAVGVGALRVAAAKHFPSDVVSGFALGAASAVVVHAIKF